MRKTPIRRKTPLGNASRRTPLRKGKRSASEFARVYGSKARVAWIKSLPCLVCMAISPIFVLARGESDNAHTVTGGTGRKANYDTIIPLCRSHHKCYDEHRFPCDDKVVRDALKADAAHIEQLWQKHCAEAA